MPSTVQVTSEVKARVCQQIVSCLTQIEKHYTITLHRPRVLFAKRGMVAAVANSASWIVDFNPILLNENTDTFIATTVPHEVAHLACDVIYPRVPGQHGPHWQEMMRLLNVAPERCHYYDTSNSRLQAAPVWHDYSCDTCDKLLSVSARRHSALKSNNKAFWHTPCGSNSSLIHIGPTQT